MVLSQQELNSLTKKQYGSKNIDRIISLIDAAIGQPEQQEQK